MGAFYSFKMIIVFLYSRKVFVDNNKAVCYTLSRKELDYVY